MVNINTEYFNQYPSANTGVTKPTVKASGPIKLTNTAPKVAVNTQDQNIFEKVGNVLDAPQAFTQKYLSPLLFKGAKTYEEGFKKSGWSPTMSRYGAMGAEMLLDPLNLLAIGPIGKLTGKVAQAIGKTGKLVATPAVNAIRSSNKITDVVKPVLRRLETVVDRTILPAGKVFEKSKTGTIIKKLVENADVTSRRNAGQALQKFEELTRRVPDNVFEEALNFREGFIPVASRAARKVAKDLDEIYTPIAKYATKYGYEIINPITKEARPFAGLKNYVTHMTDINKLKANRTLVVDYLLERGVLGRNGTRKQAEELVEKLIEKGGDIKQAFASFMPIDAPKHYGALEYQRILDLPKEVLRRDKDMIREYITNVYKRFAVGEQFGIQNQKLTQLFQKLSGDEREKLIKDITLRALDMEQKDAQAEKLYSALRKYQGFTKLGTAAISNLTQSVNTATKFGIRRTLKNIGKEIWNKDLQRKFTIESGAASDIGAGMLQLEAQGGLGKITSRLGAPGFSQVEMANRSIAANTAKDYALDMAKKTGRKLTNEELYKAAREGVETTQFTVNPLDLPAFFTSPSGRMITQFKNFGYKQAEFVVNEVVKKAIEGDFKPLIRYKTLGAGAGEITGNMKAYITGRRRPEDLAERKAENLANVGGAGIISDFYNATKYGGEGILKWLAGPSISEGVSLASGASKLVRGQGGQELYGTLLRDIPIFGSRIKRTIYPNAIEEKAGIPPLLQLPKKKTLTPRI